MKVLFVCVANIFRSQIAESYYNRETQSNDATSAGINADADHIPHEIQKIMAEDGFDLRGKVPRRMTQEMLDEADVVIAMDSRVVERIPSHYSQKLLFWNTADTIPSKGDEIRSIKSWIKEQVELFISDQKR